MVEKFKDWIHDAWYWIRSSAPKLSDRRVLAVLGLVIVLVVCVVLVFVFTGGKSTPKNNVDTRSGKQLCFDTQRSLEGAFREYYAERGAWPKRLTDLKLVPALSSITIQCPSGGKYIFIPGDPPQVKCTKHGIYIY